MIQLPTGTKIWIAAGVTDMRPDFDGLSAQAQTILQQQPFSGHVFALRPSERPNQMSAQERSTDKDD